ncbi:nuclear transport factor 2 family protein [Nocardia sp. NBC_00565]|uniref:nuclear transport factor 2 family protein n=1 Tax=Nocardia sp. NBC_00565 TaxID=2975993 RepID=UPI002E811195|nr:nuclear transport factor 2 family protein [Nocardia sp. NBC_00565]WUC03437.1 nuclear transport factor 2 family protein [Nocardia sp. NBC_00565]
MTYSRRTFMIGTGAAAFGLAGAVSARVSADPGDAAALDPATAVAAVYAIKQVKARYFRAVDTKDWDLLKQQVTPDVVIDTTGSAGIITVGDDAFIAYLRLTIGSATTVHQGHMPEIEVQTASTATGVWALQDLLIWPGNVRVLGFGHYHETYVRDGDHWRIKSNKLTRLYLDPIAEQKLFGV